MEDEEKPKSGEFKRDVEQSMQPERPDFVTSAENKDENTAGQVPTGDYRRTENTEDRRYAAQSLGQAEREASTARDSADEEQGGFYAARDKEANPAEGGFYRPMDEKRGQKGKTKKGKFMKYGGLATMFIALFVGAMGVFMTVSTELVSWKENLYSMFGQNAAVINRRSNFLTLALLNTRRPRTATTVTNIFGQQKFKVSSKMASKLKRQGIDYVETTGTDGKELRMLIYHADDGSEIPVVANETDAGRIGAGAEIDIGDGKMVTLSEGGITLDAARQRITDFDVSYDTATATFSGKIAGWFDNLGNKVMERLLGKDARNKMNMDADADSEEVRDKLYTAAKLEDDDMELNEKDRGDAEEEPGDSDDNGTEEPGESPGDDSTEEPGESPGDDGADEPSGETPPDSTDTPSDETVEPEPEPDPPRKHFEGGETTDDVMGENSKLTNSDDVDVDKTASSLTSKARKAAAMGGTVACAFLRAAGAISTTVGAIQTVNAVNYAAKYLELADKIKAGDATNVTNEAMNALNEEKTVEVYDMDGNKSTLTGSVTESQGFNTVFSMEEMIDENAPETVTMNRELALTTAMRQAKMGALSSVLGGLASVGSGAAAVGACNLIRQASGIADFTGDVLLLVGSAGIGSFIKAFLKQVWNSAILAAVMASVSLIVRLVTPIVAQWLGEKLVDVFMGKVGGTVLWAGAQSMMNSNLQMSTGRLADENGAKAVYALTKESEKEWARYERATKSPFDATSQYTFLGSLVNSFRPIINLNRKDVTGAVSSVANLAGNSALALVSPQASAAAEVAGYGLSLASEDNCPKLHSLGVAGTETCHKYNGAYTKEIDEVDPAEVYQKLASYGAFEKDENGAVATDSDGNPKIDKKSEYAKYIVACVANDAQPGEMSAAVQGFQVSTGNAVGDALLDFGINFVPGSGILDLFEAADENKNIVWNSGLACTGKVDGVMNIVDHGATLNERVKYYSMYNLDQRALEGMEIISTNSTTAFLDEYYKEHPLDNSYEGMIARYSGQTKEEVEDTLALMDYMVAVYNYDPGERYAFGSDQTKVQRPLQLDGRNEVQLAQARAVQARLVAPVVWADVRNRTVMA